MPYRSLLSSLALVLLLGFWATPSDAADSDEIFVVVTSDDAETQMMSMVLSNQVLNRGASVRVLLCSAGGRLGVADEEFPMFEPADRSPQQLLQNLINEGATVEVCAIFLPNSEFGEDDLIEGIGVAQPPAIADHMLEPDVRYFTF